MADIPKRKKKNMAAKTTKEKLEKIENVWNGGREHGKTDHYRLIFEWVKTGNLSKSEFEQAIDLVSTLDEEESRRCWG